MKKLIKRILYISIPLLVIGGVSIGLMKWTEKHNETILNRAILTNFVSNYITCMKMSSFVFMNTVPGQEVPEEAFHQLCFNEAYGITVKSFPDLEAEKVIQKHLESINK